MDTSNFKEVFESPKVKETDLWRCTVCGRFGTVGRCCGEETRERVNMEQLLAENERLRDEVERLRGLEGREQRDEALLRQALEEAEEAMRFVHTSCATFPQEPQHVQNAAWRRIVNAITKARTVLGRGGLK